MTTSTSPTIRNRRVRRWAPTALAVLTVVLGLLGSPAARAQECGCTNVGPYKVPARTAPAKQELSPNGGTFRLHVSQSQPDEVTLSITRASNGAAVESFFIPIAGGLGL